MAGVTPEERFWAKVAKSEGCWEWKGASQSDGYGTFVLGGTSRLAHRVSYAWSQGEPLPGLVIDHICHNRSCVQPDHLRAVTHQQNMQNRSGAQANSRSGVRGVSWHKGRNKWVVQYTLHGSRRHGGLFDDLDAAAEAARALRRRFYSHSDSDLEGLR